MDVDYQANMNLLQEANVYGPIEFFLTVTAMDMVAPEYGKNTLREYFTNLNYSKA